MTLWHGLSDNIVPASMAWTMARTLPNGEAHFVPGGHFVAVDIAGQIMCRLRQLLDDPAASPAAVSRNDRAASRACYHELQRQRPLLRPRRPLRGISTHVSRRPFGYLSSLCPHHELAWDCATGNGQAAVALAPYFGTIIATDASQKQIDHARPRDNVQYRVAPADAAPLADGSVDLVTVAQALHWFDLPRFYDEVRRVARPDGIIAVWCYQLHTVTPEVDAIVNRYYSDIVGADWPPERRLVEDGYQTLAFPFEEVASPPFQMVHHWPTRPGSGLPGLVVGDAAVSKADRRRSARPDPRRPRGGLG